MYIDYSSSIINEIVYFVIFDAIFISISAFDSPYHYIYSNVDV